MKKQNKIEQAVENQVQTIFHFPTAIYKIDKPEFLPVVKKVTTEFLNKRKKEVKQLDEIYPVYMTEDLRSDKRMTDFCSYIANTAWNILENQGYAMNPLQTVFTEMWCQEHYKHSAMEQHTHNFGSQIVGFYFIECPENASKVLFHDPKAAKVQINLPEKDASNATYASTVINFEPKPGMLLFTNAWLPHSFTRHGSDKPMRFIHFNLGVQQAPQQMACATPAEII
jgi:uncharacterized protein (TIGR02466 family)